MACDPQIWWITNNPIVYLKGFSHPTMNEQECIDSSMASILFGRSTRHRFTPPIRVSENACLFDWAGRRFKDRDWSAIRGWQFLQLVFCESVFCEKKAESAWYVGTVASQASRWRLTKTAILNKGIFWWSWTNRSANLAIWLVVQFRQLIQNPDWGFKGYIIYANLSVMS